MNIRYHSAQLRVRCDVIRCKLAIVAPAIGRGASCRPLWLVLGRPVPRLTPRPGSVPVAMNLIVENIRDRLRNGPTQGAGAATVRRRNISDSQLFVTPH